MRAVLVLLALFVILIAWKKSHRSHYYVDAPPQVEGSWDSGCRAKREQSEIHGAPWRVQISYKGNTQETFYILYEDDACTLPVSFSHYLGTSGFEPDLGLGSDAYRIDSTYSHFYWTQISKEFVDRANSQRFYDMSDWAASQEKEVTGRAVGPNIPITEYEGAKDYDIVRSDGNYLYFGAKSSGDQTSPSGRPTRFDDPAFRYTRMTERPTFTTIISAANAAWEAKAALMASPNRPTRKIASEYRCTCECWNHSPAGDSLLCHQGTVRQNCKSYQEVFVTPSRDECIKSSKAGSSCPSDGSQAVMYYNGEPASGNVVCR